MTFSVVNVSLYPDALVVQARESMCEHGMVKEACIEPQDDRLIGCRFRQLSVLTVQCFENTFLAQSACGRFFQKRRAVSESILRPPGIPGAII